MEMDAGGPTGAPPRRTLGTYNVGQRLVLFLWCLVALIVLGKSRQAIRISFFTYEVIEFQDLHPLIYVMAALCVTAFYCIVSVLLSLVFFKGGFHLGLTCFLTAFDLLLLVILSAGAGAAFTIDYGIKELFYTEGYSFCDRFDRFCRHVIASSVFALIASIQLLLILLFNFVFLAKKISA